MDNLQVLNDSASRAPDLGWHLLRPVGVPGDALAITRQVQGRAVLPVSPKDRGHSPTPTTRPLIEGQHVVPVQIPRTAGRLCLRVAATVQAQNVFLVILGGNGYEDVWPVSLDQSPTTPRPDRDGTQPWPRPPRMPVGRDPSGESPRRTLDPFVRHEIEGHQTHPAIG